MNNKYVSLYLIRHGTTESNERRIIQGRTDSPLTIKGIEVAQNLKNELSKIKFDLAFSSNLKRAINTAKIILGNRNLSLKTTKLITEKSFGKFEGTSADFYNKHVSSTYKTLSDKEKLNFKYSKDTESNLEVLKRFEQFADKLIKNHIGKTIMAVSHGGLMRILLIKLGYGSFNELPPGSVENGGIIHLELSKSKIKIKSVKGINKINVK